MGCSLGTPTQRVSGVRLSRNRWSRPGGFAHWDPVPLPGTGSMTKGSLRVMVRTRGREAHSAYPHLGKSALEPMLALLPELASLPLPSDDSLGATTVNVGVLHAGTEANIIPGQAEAELMFRLVGDPDPVKELLEKWAEGRAELEYGSFIPTQRFHIVDGLDTAPVAYTSDIPLLDRWGT